MKARIESAAMTVDAGAPGRDTGDAGLVARLAIALTAWTERWLPDAFIFALVFTLLVVIAAVAATPATLVQAVDAWGRGFWDLIPFTLQMSLIIITGHVLASSPPMGRLIRTMAAWPSSPRSAVAFVALVAMGSSWLHWGFSLMFSALLARSGTARRGRRSRALAAASTWGSGSGRRAHGSAVLQMPAPVRYSRRSARSSRTAAWCRAA